MNLLSAIVGSLLFGPGGLTGAQAPAYTLNPDIFNLTPLHRHQFTALGSLRQRLEIEVPHHVAGFFIISQQLFCAHDGSAADKYCYRALTDSKDI